MIVALLLVACLTAEPPAGGSCANCHGDPSGEGEAALAPPVALGGSTDPAVVGAHQAHLVPGSLGRVTACADCHVVPARIEDPGHIDDPWPADVAWSEPVKVGGATVPWDHEAGTCAVYCHGASLEGGVRSTPAWTDTGPLDCDACHGMAPPTPPHDFSPTTTCTDCHGDLAPATHLDGAVTFALAAPCDACHGTPPPSHDPATTECASCHGPFEPATHADGVVNLGVAEACDACHGTPESAAPPPDFQGNTDPSARGVGAHEVHVLGGGDSAAVACEACHVVPVGDPAHADGGPAEIRWGSITANGGLTPVWSATTLTCSDTWCHGGALLGGTVPEPVWTSTDGAASACGACHGLPPETATHPPAPTGCAGCHENAGPDFTFLQPELHVDGVVTF